MKLWLPIRMYRRPVCDLNHRGHAQLCRRELVNPVSVFPSEAAEGCGGNGVAKQRKGFARDAFSREASRAGIVGLGDAAAFAVRAATIAAEDAFAFVALEEVLGELRIARKGV